MRTRTGKRVARCTQFNERCTSGNPVDKRPHQRAVRLHAEADAVDDAVISHDGRERT